MARQTAAEKRAAAETSETPSVGEANAAAATAEEVLGDELAKRPVIVKLARIMGELGELKPEGRNQHFGYEFIKDTQVSGALRAKLARERVMIIPDVVDEQWIEVPTKRGTSYVTKMKIRFTAIDGDSGDEVSGHGFGYGDDSGDKGANKAFTAALKYWLLKAFMVGGEDAESDPKADQRASERQAGVEAVVPTRIEVAGDVGGVERGGHQDRISKAQLNQLFSLYKDLGLTPDSFASLFDVMLGIPLNLDPTGDTTEQLNKAIKALDGNQAGEFISKLMDMKDDKAKDIATAADSDEDPGAGGYG